MTNILLLVLQLAKDLLHPSVDEERRKCKLKRLVQSPNSYFMDVKCPGTLHIQFHIPVTAVVTYVVNCVTNSFMVVRAQALVVFANS